MVVSGQERLGRYTIDKWVTRQNQDAQFFVYVLVQLPGECDELRETSEEYLQTRRRAEVDLCYEVLVYGCLRLER